MKHASGAVNTQVFMSGRIMLQAYIFTYSFMLCVRACVRACVCVCVNDAFCNFLFNYYSSAAEQGLVVTQVLTA